MGEPSTSLLIAVADAGPLIRLEEIGQLPLMTLFDKLLLPDAVWDEAVVNGSVPRAGLEQLPCLARTSAVEAVESEVLRFIQANSLNDLHRGERESLFVCNQQSIPLLLTDDLAVRDAAKRLGLTPIGSLGVIVRAFRCGRLTKFAAEQCLRDLQSVSSLFVTPAIVEMAIEQLDRGPTQP